MKLMSTGSFHSSDGRKKINTKQVYFGRDMLWTRCNGAIR